MIHCKKGSLAITSFTSIHEDLHRDRNSLHQATWVLSYRSFKFNAYVFELG